jgi:hypothetical protein
MAGVGRSTDWRAIEQTLQLVWWYAIIEVL